MSWNSSEKPDLAAILGAAVTRTSTERELHLGKRIILLSGYQRCPPTGSERVKLGSIVIQEMRKLQQSAIKNPDAVSFGYTAGRWMPAA
jgi:hypothetical protein